MQDYLVRIFTPATIDQAAEYLAATIARRSKGQPSVIVPILSGALPLLGKVLKYLPADDHYYVEPMKASSYGDGEVSGELTFSLLPNPKVIAGRRVFLLDDIYETGKTLKAASHWCDSAGAVETRTLSLLIRESVPVTKAETNDAALTFDQHRHEHVGALTVHRDDFLVGFGLDYCGRYRQLQGVYAKRKLFSEDVEHYEREPGALIPLPPLPL